jgi:hypothetical protein
VKSWSGVELYVHPNGQVNSLILAGQRKILNQLKRTDVQWREADARFGG